jgi:hypothetical protein
VRLLGISGFAMAAAIVAVPTAAQQSCDRYAALEWLPDRFEEIARGEVAWIRIELVVLTDGTCTCVNSLKVDRALGKTAPQGVKWSCREATPDDRGSD